MRRVVLVPFFFGCIGNIDESAQDLRKRHAGGAVDLSQPVDMSRPADLAEPPVVPAACGNGHTDPGEACDGNDLNGFTCGTVAAGFRAGGTLACKSDCSGYIVSGCTAGNTIVAATCDLSAVSSALTSAQSGDTVVMPAGHCIWPMATLSLPNKNVVLKGAGIDQTFISRADAGGGDYKWTIIASNSAGNPFRVTGFTFTWSNSTNTNGSAIGVFGSSQNWRVDHIKYVTVGGKVVQVNGPTYGVIDHITSVNSFGGVDVEDWGSADNGNDGALSWTRPLGLGTANWVVIEDSSFSHDATVTGFGESIESNRGARYVFRYNTIDDQNTTFCDTIDAHGACGTAGSRGWEIYGNVYTSRGGGWGMNLRGGDGVVFDNLFNFPTGGTIAHLMEYRADASNCWQCGVCYSSATQYPLAGQIRAGYFWNNKLNGNVGDPSVEGDNYVSTFIQKGRDYFTSKMPSYAPYPHPHPLVQIAP